MKPDPDVHNRRAVASPPIAASGAHGVAAGGRADGVGGGVYPGAFGHTLRALGGRLFAAVLGLTLVSLFPSTAAAQAGFSFTESRITDTDAHETRPVLGRDAGGDYVVYARRQSPSGAADLFLQRLVNGFPAGDPVPLTGVAGDDPARDERAFDASGDLVAYAAFESPASPFADVFVQRISTGERILLVSAIAAGGVGVQGGVVAWGEKFVGLTRLFLADVSGSAPPVPVSVTPFLPMGGFDLGGRFLVWSQTLHTDPAVAPQSEVFAYEIATSRTRRITESAADDTQPVTDAGWIAWVSAQPGESASTLRGVDLAAALPEVRQIVANGALNSDPAVQGGRLVFRSRDAFGLNTSLADLPTSRLFQLSTASPEAVSSPALSLLGNAIAYSDLRFPQSAAPNAPQEEVFVGSFTLPAADPPTPGGGLPPPAADAPQAVLKLKAERALSLAQTSAREWTLAKTGLVNPAARRVNWDILAQQSPVPANRLTLDARVQLKTSGDAPATLGSVVVRLQRWQGTAWVTVATNVANATAGDAALGATIVQNGVATPIAETAASGTIALKNSQTNAAISLVPQVALPPGTVVPMAVTATFDNNVLGLPAGARIRAEVDVTFGNAGPGTGSVLAVDINGNGTLEADEARVRTEVEILAEASVPAPITVTTPVTLSDTAADITTTGTVTFANPVFNLGATSGTVTVSYAGGADGGTIKNCARLTGTGVDLVACDTQAIAAEFVWSNGDVITYTQGGWGEPTAVGGQALAASYVTVYAATAGVLEVGLPGPGFSITFTGFGSLQDFLPASGAPGVLAGDYGDPTNGATEAGLFAGEVLALALNVDFSDVGVTLGARGVPFGDVVMCNVAGVASNTSVRQFLAAANTLLGGGAAGLTAADASNLAASLNEAFNLGVVSQFARDHLVIGSCP